jgi:hypothetical protein
LRVSCHACTSRRVPVNFPSCSFLIFIELLEFVHGYGRFP